MTTESVVPISLTLPDGRELKGTMTVPGFSYTYTPGRPPSPDAMGRAVARALVPQLAEQIAPYMPPSEPPRKEIKRDAAGNIAAITEVPATPGPYLRASAYAVMLAARLVPVYQETARYAVAKATAKR